MRKLVLAAVLVAVAACAPKDQTPPADNSAMDTAAMMTDTTHMMSDSAAMPADTAMARDTTQM
jgi:Flp pilus assembly protein TadD